MLLRDWMSWIWLSLKSLDGKTKAIAKTRKIACRVFILFFLVMNTTKLSRLSMKPFTLGGDFNDKLEKEVFVGRLKKHDMG